VIGSELATNLFRNEPAVGNRLQLADQSFEVIGVLEKQGSFLGLSAWTTGDHSDETVHSFHLERSGDQHPGEGRQLAQMTRRAKSCAQAMRHIRRSLRGSG